MNIVRNLEVPTGNILVVNGDHGLLELVVLGDYGKDVNLNQHKAVKHGPLLPLSQKLVVTISTQYGCSMGCRFCVVPQVGPGKNATVQDMLEQIYAGLSLHPDLQHGERLNVHFARMGEPMFNATAVLEVATKIKSYYRSDFDTVHPVVSTMLPAKVPADASAKFLGKWLRLKNEVYKGEAGLQLSINSTDEIEREYMFGGSAKTLAEIGEVVKNLPKPIGRKITLNFAVAGWKIDPNVLLRYFDPAYYIIKLTPMHKTAAAVENGIETAGEYTEHYPYVEYEDALRAAGYDVLVFIASEEEDLSRITCGNAILSGSLPLTDYKEIEV